MITFYNHPDPEKDISEVLDYSQKCVDRITQLFSSYKKKVDAVVNYSYFVNNQTTINNDNNYYN